MNIFVSSDVPTNTCQFQKFTKMKGNIYGSCKKMNTV